MDPSGKILFNTTFGDPNTYSYGFSIAVDPSGDVWVGGQTGSQNFPLKNPVQSLPGRQDTGFLMKLAPDGTVLYSSYFGGNSVSSVNGVATDSDGNVYVTGWTFSIDFPNHTPARPRRRSARMSFLRDVCCQA